MKKILNILLKVVLLIVVVIILFISTFAILGHIMYEEALEEVPIKDKVSEIQSKDNYTKLDDIPQIYKDAVIAAEDHRFYYHLGIDYVAIIRAIINDISFGQLKEGGSTITQQLCKNIYFTQERKLERKFAEIFMAAEVERVIDKDTILELYINTCFYGNNCDTLSEASRLYYNKEPNELNDYEATLIAGIPNAPSLYNPIKSEEKAKQRQKQVLNKMIKFGFLTEEEKNNILALED